MPFFDLLKLALRNLREAKLRATLTSMGVIVGVAVIVTMVSFGLGLQRNLLSRFKALDLFSEMTVFGKSIALAAGNVDRARRGAGDRQGPRLPNDFTPTRILDDAAIAEIGKIPGVAYVEPFIGFTVQGRSNGKVLGHQVSGATVPNSSSRFSEFAAGQMISSASAAEAVITEDTAHNFGYASPADAIGKTIEFLAPADAKKNTATDAGGGEPSSF